MSFVISVFTDETEGLLDAVPDDEEEVLLTVLLVAPPLEPADVDEVEPTVGMAILVPEEDPVVAAKAFPETRIPTMAVATPALPMAIEMDFFDSFFMFSLLGLRL